MRKTRVINTKEKKKKRIYISLGIIVSCLSLIGVTGLLYLKAQFQHVSIDKSNEALDITIEPAKTTEKDAVKSNNRTDIVQIALLGLDRRSEGEKGRADAIMIATIDYKNKKLKLTSLMRDIYIPVEGHGNTKLNHAYAYGDAPLMIKTINQNFGTDIRDYVAVDFFMLEEIIDSIGGVEVELKEEELVLLNKHMREVAKIEKTYPTEIHTAGKQLLNGKQAVAYSRIRYVGNGDFERTERQRTVLQAMVNKVDTLTATDIPNLVLTLLPYVETSLTEKEIISYGIDYLIVPFTPLQTMRFPEDGEWTSYRENGVWYMKSDIDALRNRMQEFLYEKENSSTEVLLENTPIISSDTKLLN